MFSGWGGQFGNWMGSRTPSREPKVTLTTVAPPGGAIRGPIALTPGEDGLEPQAERTRACSGRGTTRGSRHRAQLAP